MLDALGHQTRREILGLLQAGPQPVGKLAAQLPISRPAVSKHLRLLEEAQLVGYDPDGASNIYFLKAEGFAEARRYLEPFWEDALARFKAVAEGLARETHAQMDA